MDFLSTLHPKIIHFPIALFVVYALLELIGVVAKKNDFSKAAYILLLIGMLGAFAAVLTGHQAEDAWKSWTAGSHGLLEEHETFATFSLWYYFLVVILRTAFVIQVEVKKKYSDSAMKIKTGFVLLALLGCFLIYKTGEYGGKMVYGHGVGVSTQHSQEPVLKEKED